jgi:uncharacterized protein (AIM24 family)
MMANLYEPEITVDVAQDVMVALTEEQKKHVDPLNSGFVWYAPPVAATNECFSGGERRQWTVGGRDMQVLTVTLPPGGERVVTEVGSFMFGSSNIAMDVELTLCVGGGGEGCQRVAGGESCVKLLLTNQGGGQGLIGITPNFPAKIVPIQFGRHVAEDHALITQGGAYMSHLGDVDVGCDLDCSPSTCCCAGFGCCRQKITGSTESIAFLAAGGTLVFRQLEPNETITVDTRSVVAMEDSVTLGITSNGRFCTCLCGGEGCCSTTLTGPGKVFMQVRGNK